MSAPPPYQPQYGQYPPQQNYGGPGYAYPQQPYYPNQPQPAFGYGYGQQPPIIASYRQPVEPQRSGGSDAGKCCLWALLACCCGCCLAECCD